MECHSLEVNAGKKFIVASGHAHTCPRAEVKTASTCMSLYCQMLNKLLFIRFVYNLDSLMQSYVLKIYSFLQKMIALVKSQLYPYHQDANTEKRMSSVICIENLHFQQCRWKKFKPQYFVQHKHITDMQFMVLIFKQKRVWLIGEYT